MAHCIISFHIIHVYIYITNIFQSAGKRSSYISKMWFSPRGIVNCFEFSNIHLIYLDRATIEEQRNVIKQCAQLSYYQRMM